MNETGRRCDRREFLRSAAAYSVILAGTAPALGFAAEKKGRKARKAGTLVEVFPAEELMREHGALRRILLVYEETLRRLGAKEGVDPALLKEGLVIVQRLIHNLHEKLEEEYLFPRLRKAGRSVDLVYVLTAQHAAGAKLTETALAVASEPNLKHPSDVATLTSALAAFIRMYRPHAAREDSTVFFEFKNLLSPEEYAGLGEQFKKREIELLGRGGIETLLTRIDKIENGLGIAQLSSYSPR